MNNINTNLKQFKEYTPEYTGYRDEYKRDSLSPTYNTNYDIIDKNGNILTSRRKQACFAYLFSESINHELHGFSFKDKRKFIIYALQEDICLDRKEVEEYVKQLKTLRAPFSFRVEENFDLSEVDIENDLTYKKRSFPTYCSENESNVRINEKLREKKLPCFNRQNVYIFEFNLNNYDSCAKIKFLSYLIRNIYEFDNYMIVRWALDFKKKNPSKSIFSSLLSMEQAVPVFKRGDKLTNTNQIFKKEGYEACGYYKLGHTIALRSLFGVTRKSLLNLLNNRPKSPYDASCIDSISKKFHSYNIAVRDINAWGGFRKYRIQIIDHTLCQKHVEDLLKKAKTTNDLKGVIHIVSGDDDLEIITIERIN